MLFIYDICVTFCVRSSMQNKSNIRLVLCTQLKKSCPQTPFVGDICNYEEKYHAYVLSNDSCLLPIKGNVVFFMLEKSYPHE